MPCYSILGTEICIPSLDDIVNAVVNPITNTITTATEAVADTLEPLFYQIRDEIIPYFSSLKTGISDLFSGTLDTISGLTNDIWDTLKGIPDTLSDLSEDISTWVSTAVEDIGTNVGSLLDEAKTSIGTALDGAVETLGSAMEEVGAAMQTAFDGVMDNFSTTISNVWSGFGTVDLGAAGADATALTKTIEESITVPPTQHSPMEPESAWYEVQRLRAEQRDYWYQAYIMALAIEGGSLGQIDGPTTMLWQSPDVAAALDLAKEWYKAPYTIAYQPLLERYWLETFTPKIPPYQDLIGIYVKEGYLEDHWVEFPEEMGEWFKQLGYSEYWAKRLWGKHWQYPSPTQLYEMLHRTHGTQPDIGVTEEVLSNMLKLHDYEPKWRKPLEAISWRTWRIYDIRTDWEMGIEDEETILKRLIDTGFHPDEAEIILAVQKMFVLRSEIDALLREADQDFIEGWIDEEQLRANYEATPYRKEIVDLRIARAKLRRERELKRDIKRALTDRFIKGDLTEEEYAQELSRLGIVQEWISAEIERAKARKLKRVKTEGAS